MPQPVARLTPKWHALLLAVAACGGDHPAVPDAAAISDSPAGAPNVVQLMAQGHAAFLGYRDGDGPWQTVTPDADGTAKLTVTNDYQVVYVCEYSSWFDATEIDTTFGEASQIRTYCETGALAAASPTVHVTGQMLEAGVIAVAGVNDSGSTSPWSFAFDAQPGVTDLLAKDDTDALILRDLDITTPTQIPTLDLAHDGRPLTTVPVTINGRADGDSVSIDSIWETASSFMWFLSPNDREAIVPPATLVLPADDESITIGSHQGEWNRLVWAPVALSATTFDLPPALADAQLTPAGTVVEASWTTLPPAFDELYLRVHGAVGASNQDVQASPGWVAAHPTRMLAFDVSPPGYQTKWLFDLAAGYHAELEASTKYGGSGWSTSLTTDTTSSTRRDPRTDQRPPMRAGANRRAR